MIFTGVTGGEIVSLLYPLFILNAFCYIIISKESLDGASYQYSGHGAFSAFKENRIWKYGSGDHFPWDHAAVRDADRRQRVGHESRVYVPSFSRREDHRKKLRSSDSAGPVCDPSSSGLSGISIQQQFSVVLWGGSGAWGGVAFPSGNNRDKKETVQKFFVLPLCAACHSACYAGFFRRSVAGGDFSEPVRASHGKRRTDKRALYLSPWAVQYEIRCYCGASGKSTAVSV